MRTHQILIEVRDKEYRSFAGYFIPPFEYAKQYLDNLAATF